jgi:hypothetical protein
VPQYPESTQLMNDGRVKLIEELLESMCDNVQGSNDIPAIIAVTGLPGVGKTTLSKKFAKMLDYELISLDEVAKKERSERVPDCFDRRHLLGYDQYDLEKLRNLLKKLTGKRKGVVIDGVCASKLLDDIDKEKSGQFNRLNWHVVGGCFQRRFEFKFQQKKANGGWYGNYMNALVMTLALWAIKEGCSGNDAARNADVLINNKNIDLELFSRLKDTVPD